MIKRVIIVLIAVTGLAITSSAQVNPHAIGVRLQDLDGFGATISYQHGLSEANRLEFDLGWKNHNDYSAFALTGLYQWVWRIEEGFNWYAGAGGKLGAWNLDSQYAGSYSNGFFLDAAGDVGIEYIFPFGLQLSLDLIPELGLINNSGDFDFNLGFGIRYAF